MNFAALMQLHEEWTSFKISHTKFPAFLKAGRVRALAEGTVIDIRLTAPDGKVLNSNLKLKKEDLELIRRIHELI